MRFRNTKWFASSNTLLQVRVKAGLESRSGACALSTTLHSSPSKYVTANPSPEVEKELIDISVCKRLVECLSCHRCIHTSIYDKKLYDSFQALVKHFWGIKDKISIHKTCGLPFRVFLPLERNIIKHSISTPGWRLTGL